MIMMDFTNALVVKLVFLVTLLHLGMGMLMKLQLILWVTHIQ